MRKFELEICLDSSHSAGEAQRLGADRVELCARLDLDGLTPSDELIASTRDAISIGLHVIIRPREGNFHYSSQEVDQMIASIESAKKLGADGIVSGALKADGSLDVETTQILIEASKGCTFTFHRAFDVCLQPLEVLQQLESMGVDRLLTSGQGKTAIEGIDLLREMQSQVTTLGIMAGSGVNASNIPALWESGIRQFHFTSHLPGPDGLNIFNPEKMEAALRTLNRL